MTTTTRKMQIELKRAEQAKHEALLTKFRDIAKKARSMYIDEDQRAVENKKGKALLLEKLDPQHRDKEKLAVAFEIWKKTPDIYKNYSFFDWLDTDPKIMVPAKDATAPATAKTFTEFLQSKQARFLCTETDRAPYKVNKNQDGTLHSGILGNPLSTARLKGKSGDGYAACVIDSKGNLYVGEHIQNKAQVSGKEPTPGFFHASFMSGEPVMFAGMIKIENGKIKEIAQLSGHYSPQRSHLNKGVLALIDKFGRNAFDEDAKVIAADNPEQNLGNLLELYNGKTEDELTVKFKDGEEGMKEKKKEIADFKKRPGKAIALNTFVAQAEKEVEIAKELRNKVNVIEAIFLKYTSSKFNTEEKQDICRAVLIKAITLVQKKLDSYADGPTKAYVPQSIKDHFKLLTDEILRISYRASFKSLQDSAIIIARLSYIPPTVVDTVDGAESLDAIATAAVGAGAEEIAQRLLSAIASPAAAASATEEDPAGAKGVRTVVSNLGFAQKAAAQLPAPSDAATPVAVAVGGLSV